MSFVYARINDVMELMSRSREEMESNFMARYHKEVEALRGYGSGPYAQLEHTAIANIHSEKHQASPFVTEAVYNFMFANGKERQMSPRVLANKNGKAVQKYKIVRHYENHDELWTPESEGERTKTVKGWEDIILPLYIGDDMPKEFELALELPNSANPPGRHWLQILAMAIMGKTGPQTVLDKGCSINTNLKCMALPRDEDLYYFPMPVVSNKNKRSAIDEKKTKALRKFLMEQMVILETGLGMDLYNWQRPELALHAKSSTFYLDELSNQQLVDQYDRIVATKPANVKFQQVDVAIDYDKPDALEELEKSRRRIIFGRQQLQPPEIDFLFDVVCIRTMLYQLNSKQRRTVLENAHKWIKPDGIIVVQDFINYDPDNGFSPIPQRNWPGNYKTWIKNMKKSKDGFVHYFTADSGRARRVVFGPAMAKLALPNQYELVP